MFLHILIFSVFPPSFATVWQKNDFRSECQILLNYASYPMCIRPDNIYMTIALLYGYHYDRARQSKELEIDEKGRRNVYLWH